MDILRNITLWLGTAEPTPPLRKLTEAELKAIGYGFLPLAPQPSEQDAGVHVGLVVILATMPTVGFAFGYAVRWMGWL
jgi:hypothetical protein